MKILDEITSKKDDTPSVRMEIVAPPFDLKATLLRASLPVGFALVLYLIQRKLSDPDTIKSVRMRILAQVSTYADRRAKFWHDITERATNAYLADTPYGKR